MENSKYKDMKLAILERSLEGEITEAERDGLLQILEEKKAESELSQADIDKFFKDLADQYPDLEDDIEKLTKKIEKAGEAPAEDEGKEDDKEDEKEDDEEAQISEAAVDLMNLIDELAGITE